MIVLNPQLSYGIKYLMGILNSKLMSFWFIHSFGKLQRKVFPQFKVNELRVFPIHPINLSTAADKARYDRMVVLVDSMLALHKQLAAAKSAARETIMQRQIDATDAAIDRLVYDLYGLTPNEIALVETSPAESTVEIAANGE